MKKIAVSACLLGQNVRYDGTNKKNDKLLEKIKSLEVIPICPEITSGFSIPHPPIEIKNNKVIDKELNDYTDKLIKGSKQCLEKIRGCDFVILKTKSPSCGYKKIYDGDFHGNLVDGNGVFTNICLKNNIKVFTEEDLDIIDFD